jgi:hypothetical protein
VVGVATTACESSRIDVVSVCEFCKCTTRKSGETRDNRKKKSGKVKTNDGESEKHVLWHLACSKEVATNDWNAVGMFRQAPRQKSAI